MAAAPIFFKERAVGTALGLSALGLSALGTALGLSALGTALGTALGLSALGTALGTALGLSDVARGVFANQFEYIANPDFSTF